MKRILLLLMLVLVMTTSFAYSLDSLISITTSGGEKDKVTAYVMIVQKLVSEDPLKCIQFINEGMLLVENKEEYIQAKAMFLLEKSQLYEYKGLNNESLILSYEALQIFERINDTIRTISCLINLANLVEEGDSSKIKRYKEMLELSKRVNNSRHIANSYINLGFFYLQRNLLDKAIFHFHKSLNVAIEDERLVSLVRMNYLNLGVAYIGKNEFSLSLPFLEKSLKISKTTNDKIGIAEAYRELSWNYKKQGILGKAKEYLLLCIDVCEENGYVGLLNKAYFDLSIVYELEEDWKGAYKLNRKIQIINDSIQHIDAIEVNKLLQMEYQNKEQIVLLEKEKEFEARKRKIWAYFFVVILVLILALAYMFYSKQRNKNKKDKVLLEKEQMLTIQEKKLIESDLKLERVSKDKIENELQYKKEESNKMAIYISQRNQFLDAIIQDLEKSKKEPDVNVIRKGINSIVLSIKQKISGAAEQEELLRKIEELYEGFFYKLSSKYPELSENEQKLIAFSMLELTSKDISPILNISPRSVDKMRYRVRKKLGIAAETSFKDVLE